MARRILTDVVWERIEPLFKQKGRGRRGKNDRNFVEAILWIMRTGTAWRDLDTEFGPWKTHYNRFNNWAQNGRLERLLECLKKKTSIRMKSFRRLATRYDTRAYMFQAFITLFCVFKWLDVF